MNVVDFRCRPGTPEVCDIQRTAFKGITALLGTQCSPYGLDQWRQEMVDANISLGVFAGRDLETTFDHRVPNSHVAEIVAMWPDQLIGYAGIDPNKRDRALDEIKRCVEEYDFKGILMDPYMHKVSADDTRVYYPIYSLCQELDLDVYLTAGPGARIPGTVIYDASPMVLDNVARDFPEMTMIVSHGGYPWILEMVSLAWRHPNVFFEFSVYENLPGSGMYVEAANTIITEKVVFGSATPFTPFQEAIDTYEKLPFTDEARQAVMHDNGYRLLTRERRNGNSWRPKSG